VYRTGHSTETTRTGIGIGDRGRGDMCPLKFWKKIFFGQLCKIQAFSGKNRVKFGNFVNFLRKYYKN